MGFFFETQLTISWTFIKNIRAFWDILVKLCARKTDKSVANNIMM